MITTDRFVLHEVHHHPGPYRGRTAIMRRLASDGLVAATADGWKLTAKGVGEMQPEYDMADMAVAQATEPLHAEIAALQALVAEQCEALAEMVPGDAYDDKLQQLSIALDQARKAEKKNEDLQAQIDELEDWAANAAYYLEGYLQAIYGERRPVKPIEPRELRDLVNFIFEGA